MVAATVLLVVLITETLLEDGFTTYAKAPLGLRATPTGPLPTGTEAMTALLAGLMTETALALTFVTEADAPFGPIARPQGPFPTPMVAVKPRPGRVVSHRGSGVA